MGKGSEVQKNYNLPPRAGMLSMGIGMKRNGESYEPPVLKPRRRLRDRIIKSTMGNALKQAEEVVTRTKKPTTP